MKHPQNTPPDTNGAENSMELKGEARHINNPVMDFPEIEKNYLQPVKGYQKQSNSYIFTDGKAKVEVKVFTDEIIRVRLAPRGDFLEDFSYALVETIKDQANSHRVEEDSEYYHVITAKVICSIDKKEFLVSFKDKDDKILNTDCTSMHWEENPDDGGYYVYCTKKTFDDEVFFGGGDKATNLNLRGKRIQNWNSDTYSYSFDQDPLYKTIPFYLGVTQDDAYGIFFDNTFKTFFDFAAEHEDRTSFWSEGGEMRYYYIHGPELMDVVRRYHTLTGTHYMPPLWALGYHQSRWSYFPEKSVKALAAEFRKREIPCDAIYLDIDYMDGYRCFTWNKNYFPSPHKMTSHLSANGFKTVVMIDPGIKLDEDYWVFKEGKENKYFCRRGDDYFMEGFVWPGRCQFPDFTNPKVRKWWGGLYKGLVDDGVAGFWNDMNEPAEFSRGTFPDDVRHHYEGLRGSHRKAHNVYGMQMVRATYEGLRKLYKNKRPFTISRAAYAGAQRYASVWTGDNVASWEHLRIGTLQLQRLSVSGLSFCGTDIGGFTGNPDGELFTRWIQFGVFSPFMRVHSAGDTRDREPWSFGPKWEAINKKFIELRYKLLPYIYSVFWEHHKYGYPILRPVAFLEQSIDKNLFREEEFAFGDKILVSPVLNPGEESKNVYLPQGNWYYYFSDELMEGGKEISIDTPLDEMPVFIKGGSIVPEYPIMQYTGEKKMEDLGLNIYFDQGENHSYIYDDHGDTFAYEQDIYLESHLIQIGASESLTILQNRVGLFKEDCEKYRFYFTGLPFSPEKITVDGLQIDFKKDEVESGILVNKNFKKLIVK